MPVLGQNSEPKPDRVLVARQSASLPSSKYAAIEAMARGHAMATGDKPSQGELIRAGLEILGTMTLTERQAVLDRMPKIRRGRRRV